MPSTPIYDAVRALLPTSLRTSIPSSLLIWQPGQTPLSTLPEIAFAVTAYLAVIFGIQAYMKDRQPFGKEQWFKQVFLVHNVLLSLGSAFLLAVMLEEIVPVIRERGWFYSICGAGAWTMVRTDQRASCQQAELISILSSCFSEWRHST